MEVAGVALPEAYRPDGQSMLSAFKGEPLKRTNPIYWEWRGGDNQDYTWPSLGVRDGKWKLIVNKQQQKNTMLAKTNYLEELSSFAPSSIFHC